MDDSCSAGVSSAAVSASPASVLRNRNDHLLWIGEGIALLGNPYCLFGLPWLAVQLTGNAPAAGPVLVTGGIPGRAPTRFAEGCRPQAADASPNKDEHATNSSVRN